jgi:hypothetical protein
MFCLTGCLESRFMLSDDSRLPKWFVLPESMERSDFTVKMELYSSFSGGENVYKLYEKGTFFPIQKFTVASDMQPSIFCKELKSPAEGFPKGYPCYFVITKDGITDIIELRKMEPIFYMTDDTDVWEELGIKQK